VRPFAYRVRPPEAGQPLLDFLAARLGCSRRKAKALLDARAVFVNSRRVWMAHHELHAGDGVEVQRAPAAGPPATLPVVCEEDPFVVVNKPAGMSSTGPGSAEALARSQLGAPALRAVHRLDRDTSGCLLLSRTAEGFAAAVALFRDRQVHKRYHAIALGRLAPPRQDIRRPLGGRPAATRVTTAAANPTASHLLITIDTGRTHQIRQHLAGIGHPVLGDRRYGTRRDHAPLEKRVPRQMLHAFAIAFRHPANRRAVRAESPLPADFMSTLRRLRLT
jgi:RluA family pseudouridine synthase